MKTILGTFLIAALLVVSRTEASTVHHMRDQSNPREAGVDHQRGTNSDNQHGQHDFLPSGKWKIHNNNERHGDFEGRHAGYEGRHDGFEGWHAGYEGRHDGLEGKHGDFEGWHHINKEFFCHEKPVPAVPIPAAFWLFGSGMLLLGRIATRRRT